MTISTTSETTVMRTRFVFFVTFGDGEEEKEVDEDSISFSLNQNGSVGGRVVAEIERIAFEPKQAIGSIVTSVFADVDVVADDDDDDTPPTTEFLIKYTS